MFPIELDKLAARDLSRGRKRAGWKREFIEALEEAAIELGTIKRSGILRTVREYRESRKKKLL